MSATQKHNPPDPGFDVEIKTSGRAYDAAAPARPAEDIVLSPARAAAKAQVRRRNITLLVVAVVGILVIGVGFYISNPNFHVPDNAVARVNGEYIYDQDVAREVDLNKVAIQLSKSITATQQTTPTEGSALETLIDRKIQLQAIQKAGVTLTPAEADGVYHDALTGMGATEAELKAALARYKLTVNDFKATTSDVYLIEKYEVNNIAAGAGTLSERNQRINDWQTNLSTNSKVDRLKAPGPGTAPIVGSQAPDFTLKDMSGHDVKLSALVGKPIMINFWATWCPPCRSEIPDIVQMYSDTHQAGNYEILGVATNSDTGTINAFRQEFGMSFPILPDNNNAIISQYHVLPIPTTFFIDKDGIISDINLGPVTRPLMEQYLLAK